MRALALVAAALIAAGGAHGQDKVSAPKFPLNLRAPENSHWTISLKRKAGIPEGSKEAYVTELSVTKTGPIYHEVATVTNGKSWEKWVFLVEQRQYGLIRYGDGLWKRLPNAGVVQEATDYSQSDFEELQWMGEQTYKGVAELEKAQVFLFETNTNKGPLTKWEAYNYDYGAASDAARDGKTYGTNLQVLGYLSVASQLPAKFDNGVETREYHFGDPPSGRQQPPAPVVTELAKWVAEVKARMR